MKPFLILQLRPEAPAADEEFTSILARSGLDGSQVRRLRLDAAPLPALSLDDYAGVIVGGGPGCVSDPPETKDPLEARIEADILGLMPEILARDMPYLGCCYGLGILAHALGGDVAQGRYSEPVGAAPCSLTDAGRRDPLLAGLPETFDALVGHKEAVQALPPGAVHLVSAPDCPIQVIRHGKNVYATQFHPEADGQSFATRIEIYQNRGYFPPAEADALTERVLATRITEPGRILARFAELYG